MNSPVFLDSFPKSPDGVYSLAQPTVSYKGDPREELLPIVFYKNGKDIDSFDQYRLLPGVAGWPHWKSDGFYCFFRAMRYREGTFPAYREEYEPREEYEVLVVINSWANIRKEYRIFALPRKVAWSEKGDSLVLEFDEDEVRIGRKAFALKEIERARPYIGGAVALEDGSPVHDPTRLENYLHFYRSDKCGPDPIRYAVRLRNRYLEMKKMEIPYTESILDD